MQNTSASAQSWLSKSYHCAGPYPLKIFLASHKSKICRRDTACWADHNQIWIVRRLQVHTLEMKYERASDWWGVRQWVGQKIRKISGRGRWKMVRIWHRAAINKKWHVIKFDMYARDGLTRLSRQHVAIYLARTCCSSRPYLNAEQCTN